MYFFIMINYEITLHYFRSNFKKLVSIEGIRYNSSKNQLIRRSSNSPTKSIFLSFFSYFNHLHVFMGFLIISEKRSVSSKTQDQFYIASNGKTLRRIDTTKKGHISSSRFSFVVNRNIFSKRTSLVSLKQTVKTNVR